MILSPDACRADLLVIGGGALGAFHALHAVRRGLRVMLLERHGAPRGATVRNFGQVVPSGMDRQWQPHGRASLEIYKSLQAEFDISVRQLGSIYLASDDDEATLIEELQQINAAADYPCELWTARQCRQRYPQLRPDYCRGGLFFPEEVSVNPRVMIHRLHRYLNEQPRYQSRFRTAVVSLSATAHGPVVATTSDGGLYEAEKAVVCCGSEFQTLYPQMFRSGALQAVKLQMLRLTPQPGISLPGNILTGRSIRRYESFSQCASWAEIKAREPQDPCWQQWGVHILFKQEVDGGIILGDSHEYAPADRVDQLDFDIRNDINQFFVSEGRKILDLPSWDVEAAWYGVYCQTNDPSGIFTTTIDNNIHVVTGIGGKGMTSSAGYAHHSLQEIYHD